MSKEQGETLEQGGMSQMEHGDTGRRRAEGRRMMSKEQGGMPQGDVGVGRDTGATDQRCRQWEDDKGRMVNQ